MELLVLQVLLVLQLPLVAPACSGKPYKHGSCPVVHHAQRCSIRPVLQRRFARM